MTKKIMIKLEMEIIGYRINIRLCANTQSKINVTSTDSNIWGFGSVDYFLEEKWTTNLKELLSTKNKKAQ